MHEMPMTTAPMRPTVPALSPFFGEAAGALRRRRWARGAVGAWVSAHREPPSVVGAGAGHHDHRHREFVQHLRRGRAEEEAPRLREAARADDGELAGLPAEVRDGVFDAVAAGDDDIGVDAVGERFASASASTSSACAAPAMRMTPVSTLAGRSTDTSESSRSSAPVAAASDGASSSSASAPGRVPIAAVMRVMPATGSMRARALGREHHGHVGGVQQLARDRAEPMAAAESAVRGADDDERGAELVRRPRRVPRRTSRRSGRARCARRRGIPGGAPPASHSAACSSR